MDTRSCRPDGSSSSSSSSSSGGGGGGGGSGSASAQTSATAALTLASDNVFYSSAACSLVCSLLTLALIVRMRKKTGYLGIVASLTVSQSLYDCSFLMFELYSLPGGKFAQRFLSYLGGLSSTLWTNVLSYLLLVIIRYGRQFNVKKNYHYLFAIVFVPSLVVAITALVTDMRGDVCVYEAVFWVSFCLRILSIIFNIACYALISLKLRAAYSLGNSSSSSSSSGGGGGGGSTMLAAVRVLASRLKYYALIQVVTRSTEIGYEIAYGKHGYDSPSDAWSKQRWAAFFIEAVLCPAAGVGYLVTFLVMQPSAWDALLTLARCLFCCSCCFGGRSRRPDGLSTDSAVRGGTVGGLGAPGSIGAFGAYAAGNKSKQVVVRVGGAMVAYDGRNTSVDAPQDLHHHDPSLSFSQSMGEDPEQQASARDSSASSLYSSSPSFISSQSRPISARASGQSAVSLSFSVASTGTGTGLSTDQRLRLLQDDEAVLARLRVLDDDELVEVATGGAVGGGGGGGVVDDIPAAARLSHNIL